MKTDKATIYLLYVVSETEWNLFYFYELILQMTLNNHHLNRSIASPVFIRLLLD